MPARDLSEFASEALVFVGRLAWGTFFKAKAPRRQDAKVLEAFPGVFASLRLCVKIRLFSLLPSPARDLSELNVECYPAPPGI